MTCAWGNKHNNYYYCNNHGAMACNHGCNPTDRKLACKQLVLIWQVVFRQYWNFKLNFGNLSAQYHS